MFIHSLFTILVKLRWKIQIRKDGTICKQLITKTFQTLNIVNIFTDLRNPRCVEVKSPTNSMCDIPTNPMWDTKYEKMELFVTIDYKNVPNTQYFHWSTESEMCWSQVNTTNKFHVWYSNKSHVGYQIQKDATICNNWFRKMLSLLNAFLSAHETVHWNEHEQYGSISGKLMQVNC